MSFHCSPIAAQVLLHNQRQQLPLATTTSSSSGHLLPTITFPPLALPFRLDKGVIVYICDSRGVRDIIDTDRTNAVATSEPLVVLDVGLHARNISSVSIVDSEYIDESGNPIWKNRVES